MFSLFISFFANLNVCLWLIIIAFYFFAHIFDYLKLWTVRVYLFSIFIFLILETNKEINKDVTFFYNLPSCTYSLTNSLTLLAHFVSNRYTIYKYTNIQICQFIHFIQFIHVFIHVFIYYLSKQVLIMLIKKWKLYKFYRMYQQFLSLWQQFSKM